MTNNRYKNKSIDSLKTSCNCLVIWLLCGFHINSQAWNDGMWQLWHVRIFMELRRYFLLTRRRSKLQCIALLWTRNTKSAFIYYLNERLFNNLTSMPADCEELLHKETSIYRDPPGSSNWSSISTVTSSAATWSQAHVGILVTQSQKLNILPSNTLCGLSFSSSLWYNQTDFDFERM